MFISRVAGNGRGAAFHPTGLFSRSLGNRRGTYRSAMLAGFGCSSHPGVTTKISIHSWLWPTHLMTTLTILLHIPFALSAEDTSKILQAYPGAHVELCASTPDKSLDQMDGRS